MTNICNCSNIFCFPRIKLYCISRRNADKFFPIHLIYVREKWGSTRGKKRRKSSDVRNFRNDSEPLDTWLHHQRQKGQLQLQADKPPQDQSLSAWTICFPHPLCTWPSATKSAADAPSGTPRWKGERAPFHPCHMNTMRLTYSLLFMVEIEYFVREILKVQRQKKFTQSPVILDVINDKIASHQSSKAANLPTGHLQSHVPLNDNLW